MSYSYRHDDDYDDYEEEEETEKSTSATRTVVARAPRTEAGRARRARNGIRPGDKILVTSGFDYEVGGKRPRYLRSEKRLEAGPAWTDAEREGLALERRALAVSRWSGLTSQMEMLEKVREFEARTGLSVKWPARSVVEDAIVKGLEALALKELDEAEWALVTAAEAGDEVTFRGSLYRKGSWYTHTVYHSDAEYYGHLCDATCYGAWDLVPVVEGERTLRILSSRMPRR